jgi:hypothetical protein
MTKLVLPGGTDVAELALFSVDALPARSPEADALRALEQRAALMRFPTGKDGSYLLHAYIDEAVPDELLRYCDVSGVQQGRLELEHGRLGFGGIESVFAGFEPNAAIRSDAVLAPGKYAITGYRTAFPEHRVKRAIEAALSKDDQKHLAAPMKLVVSGLIFMAGAIVLKAWLVAAVIALAVAAGLRMFFKNPHTVRLLERKRTIERAHPSIVVSMSLVKGGTGPSQVGGLNSG